MEYMTTRHKTKIVFGKRSHKDIYRYASLEQLVGKTIEAIGTTVVDGPNNYEPCTILFFTDKTKHGFVHPGNT